MGIMAFGALVAQRFVNGNGVLQPLFELDMTPQAQLILRHCEEHCIVRLVRLMADKASAKSYRSVNKLKCPGKRLVAQIAIARRWPTLEKLCIVRSVRIVAFGTRLGEGTVNNLLRLLNLMTTPAKLFICCELFEPVFTLDWDMTLDTIAKIHGTVCESEILHRTMAVGSDTRGSQFPTWFALLAEQNARECDHSTADHYSYYNKIPHPMHCFLVVNCFWASHYTNRRVAPIGTSST